MKLKHIIFTYLLFLTPIMLIANDFTNSIGINFKNIKSGSYMMGTSTSKCTKDNPYTYENEYKNCMNTINKNETPQHKVKIKSFYIATTEVTQGQWYAIMGTNPSKFKNNNSTMPVEQVSWESVQKFIKKLNKKEKTRKYRLPTEKEWEYAARAGSDKDWSFGNDRTLLNKYAWYDTSSTHPVAKKEPNNWGLYDMYGNVYEWTSSWYTKNYTTKGEHQYRVLRGGSYWSYADDTRSATRFNILNDKQYKDYGFRLVRSK